MPSLSVPIGAGGRQSSVGVDQQRRVESMKTSLQNHPMQQIVAANNHPMNLRIVKNLSTSHRKNTATAPAHMMIP